MVAAGNRGCKTADFFPTVTADNLAGPFLGTLSYRVTCYIHWPSALEGTAAPDLPAPARLQSLVGSWELGVREEALPLPPSCRKTR